MHLSRPAGIMMIAHCVSAIGQVGASCAIAFLAVGANLGRWALDTRRNTCTFA
jgi:hypothetical protein